MSSPPRVRFDDAGLEVEGGLLWLDATQPRGFGVVSHAHGDHVARHKRILCTPATAAFMRRRGGPGPEFVERAYGDPFRVGDVVVTLLPAGHILGSALVFLEGPGGTLLYTGDVRLEGGLTCPAAEPRPADVLVTEATYGRPDRRLPPAAEVRAELAAWARDVLEGGETPVLLAYALGKAQEVMQVLCREDVPVAAHGTAWHLCDTYRAHGIRFPGCRLLRPGSRRAAIVVPPRWAGAPEVRSAAPLRVAAVTGWGEQARGEGVERVFPLSDHSDFDGLLRVVEAVSPRTVHVLHGYAAEFAAALRERGYDASPVPGHRGPVEGEIPGAFGA